MTRKPKVSVVIPTFKRAHLIRHVFEGLKKQTYRDFEVVVVLKPSGDGTQGIVEKYRNFLDINLVLQNKGYVVDAMNLGLEYSSGDIIAFLDDDAIPLPGWIKNHLESYATSNVGGVAGNVIPAIFKGENAIPVKDNLSDIIPNEKYFLDSTGRKVWNPPLEGLEDFLVYVSKAGSVEYNSSMSHLAWCQTTKSLLGMGCNMSVLSEAVKDFRFPNSWILGLANEQFLGWYIWKKGYNLMFNPKARVYHLIHNQTLTRGVKEMKKETLRWIEYNLLFYRLHDFEGDLSNMHRIVWLIFSLLDDTKKLCWDREISRFARMKSKFYSEIIGLKWLLSRKLKVHYSPLIDLEKFV
ncbi:MAG: glycosyltransferase family 2 protein [Promethearchaeota archaeon]